MIRMGLTRLVRHQCGSGCEAASGNSSCSELTTIVIAPAQHLRGAPSTWVKSAHCDLDNIAWEEKSKLDQAHDRCFGFQLHSSKVLVTLYQLCGNITRHRDHTQHITNTRILTLRLHTFIFYRVRQLTVMAHHREVLRQLSVYFYSTNPPFPAVQTRCDPSTTRLRPLWEHMYEPHHRRFWRPCLP